MRALIRVLTLCILVVSVAAAQSSDPPSSMTVEERKGYISGEGAGEGRPAETFGYPSPKRVLELEKELNLTTEQKSRISEIYMRMKRDGSFYGKRIVAEELALDNFFRTGQLDWAALANRVEKVGNLKWKFRTTHFAAHFKTRQVLTPEQVIKFQELRAADSGRTSGN